MKHRKITWSDMQDKKFLALATLTTPVNFFPRNLLTNNCGRWSNKMGSRFSGNKIIFLRTKYNVNLRIKFKKLIELIDKPALLKETTKPYLQRYYHIPLTAQSCECQILQFPCGLFQRWILCKSPISFISPLLCQGTGV